MCKRTAKTLSLLLGLQYSTVASSLDFQHFCVPAGHSFCVSGVIIVCHRATGVIAGSVFALSLEIISTNTNSFVVVSLHCLIYHYLENGQKQHWLYPVLLPAMLTLSLYPSKEPFFRTWRCQSELYKKRRSFCVVSWPHKYNRKRPYSHSRTAPLPTAFNRDHYHYH